MGRSGFFGMTHLFMPEPTVRPLGFVGFKYSVAGSTVVKSVVEAGSDNIIKNAHVSGVSSRVVLVVILVGVAKQIKQ